MSIKDRFQQNAPFPLMLCTTVKRNRKMAQRLIPFSIYAGTFQTKLAAKPLHASLLRTYIKSLQHQFFLPGQSAQRSVHTGQFSACSNRHKSS